MSHRRASDFLVRDKKVTKEARLPTAVRQNSLRGLAATFKQLPKYEGLPVAYATLARAGGAGFAACCVGAALCWIKSQIGI